MTYVFRVHPLLRFGFVVVLCWIGATCIQAPGGELVLAGVLMIQISGVILLGLFRMFRAYLRTW